MKVGLGVVVAFLGVQIAFSNTGVFADSPGPDTQGPAATQKARVENLKLVDHQLVTCYDRPVGEKDRKKYELSIRVDKLAARDDVVIRITFTSWENSFFGLIANKTEFPLAELPLPFEQSPRKVVDGIATLNAPLMLRAKNLFLAANPAMKYWDIARMDAYANGAAGFIKVRLDQDEGYLSVAGMNYVDTQLIGLRDCQWNNMKVTWDEAKWKEVLKAHADAKKQKELDDLPRAEGPLPSFAFETNI